MRRYRRGAAACTAALLLLALVCSGRPRAATAAPAGASEYELKAAFLYNFAKFVEWPDAGATGPICFGIVGDDPFGALLDRVLAGKTVHDRPIAIRRFAATDAPAPCHLLFVSAAAEPAVAPATWTAPGVLAVGERPDFLAAGGVIAFSMDGNKLRFSVNASAAERAQLKLSSQLLKLALHVVKEGD